MIERSVKLTLLDKTEVTLPNAEGKQYWELCLAARPLSEDGASIGGSYKICTTHVSRDSLAEIGHLLTDNSCKTVTPTKTPEDLLIEILESLGVRFEE